MSEAALPIPTESQLALLKRIARRAETGRPMATGELQHDVADNCDSWGIWHFVDFGGNNDMGLNEAGHAALEAGLATKQCAADGCTEVFTFEPEHEEVDYCSERCEASREGL